MECLRNINGGSFWEECKHAHSAANATLVYIPPRNCSTCILLQKYLIYSLEPPYFFMQTPPPPPVFQGYLLFITSIKINIYYFYNILYIANFAYFSLIRDGRLQSQFFNILQNQNYHHISTLQSSIDRYRSKIAEFKIKYYLSFVVNIKLSLTNYEATSVCQVLISNPI